MRGSSQLTVRSSQKRISSRKYPAHSFQLGVLLIAALAIAGCRGKSATNEAALPLPPGVDSGLYEGQFVQVDYGFGFPVPPKWNYLRLSADQEVDEVGRFCDPTRELILRLSVQILGPSQKFTPRSWPDLAEQDLKNHQFTVQKKDSTREFKTGDAGNWAVASFRMADPKGEEWMDEEWGLSRNDLLLVVHVTLPEDLAVTDRGKRLLRALEGALTQVHWYMPIGPRGISVDRYELQQFTGGFCRALESRSANRVGAYFDDMYPERAKWNAFYLAETAGDPKAFELKAELSGLVINGDYASAEFTLTREDKNASKAGRSELKFQLSKTEGAWKIKGPIGKD